MSVVLWVIWEGLWEVWTLISEISLTYTFDNVVLLMKTFNLTPFPNSFRQYCVESELLPIELHVTLSDIINGEGHIDDMFPYFYQHATTMFPHLTCLEELKTICDLRRPMNWYPEARGLSRKVIYHAGR